MGKIKHSLIPLMFFLCFAHKSEGQCLNVLTTNEYNCITNALEATVTVVGATPPYTLTSNPPGITGVVNSSTFSLTNVPANSSGNYTINVFAAGTCSNFGAGSFVSPSTPANIVFSPTMVTCYGGNNGFVAAIFTSGAGPYSWLWSTGSTNSSISGLTAGVYTVSITNNKNCTATNTINITEPPVITSNLSTTLIPCFGSTLTTAITTTGGVAPYTYTVNGNPITTSPGNVATNLSTGLQSIITKDSKGCVKTNTLLLNQAAQQIITPTVSSPLCPNQSNGSVSVVASGPVAGYTYSWNPGNSTSATLNNIPAGTYTLYLTDASNCITTSLITVPPAPSITPVSVVQKENCSAVDGAFTLNVSGGFPPYTYTTLPANSNGSVVTGLSSGSYTTFITDSHACLDSAITHVGNLSTVSLNILTVTPVECYNNCTGSVLLNVQNGVLPISYSLTGMPLTTNSVVSNLCAGVYFVKAIDNIGCPAFDTINFPTPPVFSYSAATPPAICIGKKTQLSATASGGTGALSYIWYPGPLTGATVEVGPTVTTTYSLNVYDSKGCTLPSYSVLVKVNPQISIDISNSDAGICPGTTAQITPTVTGGDGNYSYEWLPGGSKGSTIYVENITIPTYTLIVADGCGTPKAVKEINIKLHPVIRPLYVQTGEGGCVPYCTNFINITPGSKNAIWNFGDKPYEQKGDTTYYCYEKAGSFNLRLVVTDSNNCKASYTYTQAVKVLERPSAGFITDPAVITLNDAENVQIKNISGNASGYTWFIDDKALGNSKDVSYTFRDTGYYDIKLIASNKNGCKDSTIRSICVFEGFNFYMPRAFTPNNDGLNDVLLPMGTGWLFANYKFEIYNRWGHKVFSTSDVHKGWDGGLEVNPYVSEITKAHINDVYSWRVVLTDNMEKEHELRGFVTLVR